MRKGAAIPHDYASFVKKQKMQIPTPINTMSKLRLNKASLNEIASPSFDVERYSVEEKKEVDPQKRSAKKIQIKKYMYSAEESDEKNSKVSNKWAGVSDQVLREESRDDDDTMLEDYSQSKSPSTKNSQPRADAA